VELHLNEFRETKSDSFTEIRKPQTICSASFAKGSCQAQNVTSYCLGYGWGTCGQRSKCDPREHLIWPASEFLLHMSEHNIASKRSSTISRYL